MGDMDMTSASDRGKLALKKMEEIYQCPVCLRLPTCNIYQCREGHLVCADCYKKLPRTSRQPVCPTCRARMPRLKIRCRAAEQAIKYLDRPCKFTDKGCKEVGDQAQMQAHMKNCNYGRSLEESLSNMEERVKSLKSKADILLTNQNLMLHMLQQFDQK